MVRYCGYNTRTRCCYIVTRVLLLWLGILDTAQGHIAAVVTRVLLLWLGILDTVQGHAAAV